MRVEGGGVGWGEREASASGRRGGGGRVSVGLGYRCRVGRVRGGGEEKGEDAASGQRGAESEAT
jgi:hypothetical protein